MPGWFGGYIGEIDFEINGNWKKLDNYAHSWTENGKKLDSFISLNPIEIYLDDRNTRLVSGVAYYEYLRRTKNIIKEGGKFKVVEEEEVIDVRWSNFWFTNKSFIIIERRDSREKVFELISYALSGEVENISPIEFNIENIFNDYPSQWLGGFRDREGHIHSGQFYGEDIIHDDEMGDAYIRTQHKNQVGFLTEYFGPEIKIRATRDGYLQIYSNLDDKSNIIFEFIRDELSQYII